MPLPDCMIPWTRSKKKLTSAKWPNWCRGVPHRQAWHHSRELLAMVPNPGHLQGTFAPPQLSVTLSVSLTLFPSYIYLVNSRINLLFYTSFSFYFHSFVCFSCPISWISSTSNLPWKFWTTKENIKGFFLFPFHWILLETYLRIQGLLGGSFG